MLSLQILETNLNLVSSGELFPLFDFWLQSYGPNSSSVCVIAVLFWKLFLVLQIFRNHLPSHYVAASCWCSDFAGVWGCGIMVVGLWVASVWPMMSTPKQVSADSAVDRLWLATKVYRKLIRRCFLWSIKKWTVRCMALSWLRLKILRLEQF